MKWLLAAMLAMLVLAGCGSDRSDTASRTEAESSSAYNEPPRLVVYADMGLVEVPGFDYCWTGAGCADSFGSNRPTPITISDSVVRIEWIDDGVLTAIVRDEDATCVDRLGLDEGDSPGEWELRASGRSSPYRIVFHGERGQDSSLYEIEVTSTVPGPNARPIATVWWPDTQDTFGLSVVIEHVGGDAHVALELTDSSDRQITVPLEDGYFDEPGRCGPVVAAEASIDGIDRLGQPPFAVLLTVDSPLGVYELEWTWPEDHSEDGEFSRSMEPADR